VSAVLDQAGVGGVLGTVAGDDTVLVVADEKTGGKRVAARIAELREATGDARSAAPSGRERPA
jgi:transcriptional regulator of arginine metabolism